MYKGIREGLKEILTIKTVLKIMMINQIVVKIKLMIYGIISKPKHPRFF